MQLVEPRPNRPIPIRITPLIDVVFILLVFFMLTTRLLPVDYLELGNDTSQRSTTEGDPRPELRVEVDGRILWQDTRYSLQELVPALTAAGVSEANLETAPEASLASFTGTLSTLDNAGITPHWKRSGTPES
ncbi:biopolymer transport protein ExbD [Marinobacter sp. MBR-99]|jgi:biopolymer transport protein ExbD|uniref:ExbD/TolR family protein n=1 Tax=Marinobacter sp. MBR-99 TaxID=3156461 RepID=UPI00339A6381